jgi:hypothetical protein
MYIHKRELIERELERCGAELRIRTLVGIPPRGPWQPVLDAIANDADKAKQPDLTFLIRNARTNYPSRIGRRTTKQPTDDQKMQEIIDNPGTPNPFSP